MTLYKARNPKPGCPVLVSQPGRGVSVNQCCRKIVRRGLRGLHASAEERAEAKEKARAQAEQLADEQMRQVSARAERLSETLGIEMRVRTRTPYAGPNSLITSPTGYVEITLDALEELARKMGAL